MSSKVCVNLVAMSCAMSRLRKHSSIDSIGYLNTRKEQLVGSVFCDRFVEFSNKSVTLVSRLIFPQMKPHNKVSHDRLLSVYIGILEDIGFITIARNEESSNAVISVNATALIQDSFFFMEIALVSRT